MISREEITILCRPEVQQAIRANLDRDPLQVALDRQVPEARLVATQIKYLQRARRKLPSYAQACCILPPRAFEQASSEQTAAYKPIEGDRVLDLTCGLGVDAMALSRRFRRVVTLERNEALVEVARINLQRLGITNVKVVHTSAEEYIAHCRDHFDWIYADPDRRSAEGRKLVRLEDCSPDIVALYPRLRELADALAIKNSPLFDVEEASRYFPRSRVEVLSLDDECKEVLIYDDGRGPLITATALGQGSYDGQQTPSIAQPPVFDPHAYQWLIIPDVALQKCRLVREHLAGKADCWSENGYGFAAVRPEGVLGRIEAIEAIERFNPKLLKRALKGHRVELLKRDFPISIEELRQRLAVKPGGEMRLAFTKIGEEYWTIRLK
ncbi:MAG: RsmD family RNA methyltransferase [Alistipes sp.]|nr:RsmD family RNA methyltransferase [Alistipes sp.]